MNGHENTGKTARIHCNEEHLVNSILKLQAVAKLSVATGRTMQI